MEKDRKKKYIEQFYVRFNSDCITKKKMAAPLLRHLSRTNVIARRTVLAFSKHNNDSM